MKLYALVFLAWDCPGGPLSGFLPEKTKPLLCEPRARLELYDPARLPKAKSKLLSLPVADLLSCRGTSCESIVERKTTVSFTE